MSYVPTDEAEEVLDENQQKRMYWYVYIFCVTFFPFFPISLTDRSIDWLTDFDFLFRFFIFPILFHFLDWLIDWFRFFIPSILFFF